MLTTCFVFSILIPAHPVPPITVQTSASEYLRYVASPSAESRRLDSVSMQYQALPPDGQALFAQRLKSAQDAVQQSDEATQAYQNALQDAKGRANTRSDPQAQRGKMQEVSDLGRRAMDMRKNATNVLSQLSYDITKYKQQAQATRRNTLRDPAQQPPGLSDAQQPGTSPSVFGTPSQPIPPHSRRFEQLLRDYQTLSPDGQNIFADKLRAVQAAVQQSDQAAQNYQAAINELNNISNRRNNSQASQRKLQEVNDLAQTATNLRKAAMDQTAQLSAEMASYRRQAGSSPGGGVRFRDPGNLGQQPAPMPPDTPALGFPQQPVPGEPSMQPYTGARTPGMYPPQQQPFPGQYNQPYPPLNSGPSQTYPQQPVPYQEPIQQYGSVPYPDPYSQQQQPYPGQYDPQQYPVPSYPQQGPDIGYGANQPYPPQVTTQGSPKASSKDETMQQVIQGVFGLMQKGMSSPTPAGPEQAPPVEPSSTGQDTSGNRR